MQALAELKVDVDWPISLSRSRSLWDHGGVRLTSSSSSASKVGNVVSIYLYYHVKLRQIMKWPWRLAKQPTSNKDAATESPSSTPQSQPRAPSRKTFPSGLKRFHNSESDIVEYVTYSLEVLIKLGVTSENTLADET